MTTEPEVRKQTIIRIGLNLLLVTFFLLYTAGAFRWQLLERLEHITYDMRLLWTLPGGIDQRVVIVDIDEKSLAQEGQWPWGRDRLAELVALLFDRYQIRLLGMDVVFAERDGSSGIDVLEELARNELEQDHLFQQKLKELRPQLDNDERFAQVLRGRPVILGYYFNLLEDPKRAFSVGSLPEASFRPGSFPPNIRYLSATGFGANLREFQENALSAGHFTAVADPLDGILRRVPMLIEHAGALYESLSLAIARKLLGVEELRLVSAAETDLTGDVTPEWIAVGRWQIPIGEELTTLIPYRGLEGSYPYVSAVDILQGNADLQALRGAIALLGTSAPGLLDLRSAPVQSTYPGVEVHANLITGILDQNLKAQPSYLLGAEFLLILGLGLSMTYLLTVLGPSWSSLVTAIALFAVIGLNLVLWVQGNLVLPLATSVLLILSMFLLNMSYGYFTEQRSKRRIEGLFGQYVPPALVDEMSKHPDSISLESESREMTVLFSDVQGFTTIAENLEPTQLSQLMNEFLTSMTQVIFRHKGTIDKYIGDAVMAFWGAPLEDPEHAQQAALAAIEMCREVENLQTHFDRMGWPRIRIGVGISTGVMRVGDMGSEIRRAYTVMGDAVNLGSRLEGLTRSYGVEIVVSEATRNSVQGIVFRELDRVRVKGKDRPVAIYEPVGLENEVSQTLLNEVASYHQALSLYRRQDWDGAELQFLTLKKSYPAIRLYQIYADRIARYRLDPPSQGWDGVSNLQEK